jgi:hypothetical protein
LKQQIIAMVSGDAESYCLNFYAAFARLYAPAF